jgi:hypothetical protein
VRGRNFFSAWLTKTQNLVGDQYSLISSSGYWAQLAFCCGFTAFLIVRVPTRLLMSTCILCWGATMIGLAFSKSFGPLLANRFLLGMFEAINIPLFSSLVLIQLVDGTLIQFDSGRYDDVVPTARAADPHRRVVRNERCRLNAWFPPRLWIVLHRVSGSLCLPDLVPYCWSRHRYYCTLYVYSKGVFSPRLQLLPFTVI